MSQMLEVMIESVRVSLTSQQRIVLLRSLEGERYLPIWIGPYEAESITIALQEIELARPQTHDLVITMLKKLDLLLRRVEITSLKDDVFYGNLVVEKDGKLIDIDARPSDSIALAVRAHVPILLAEEILQSAGIIPEPDLQFEPAEGEKEEEQANQIDRVESAEAKKRLSVFEDFLKNIDINDGTGTPDNPNPEDAPPVDPDKN
jgi:uncharacterized protein